MNFEADAFAEKEPLDRLDELLSLFFDDCLTPEETSELNALLQDDPAALTRSAEAARMHADLTLYFRGAPAFEPPARDEPTAVDLGLSADGGFAKV